MEIPDILDKMSLREKIAMCSGADFWHTKAMEQIGVPAIMMADGPHGLRKQLNESDMLGINQSVPATCFPTAAATGCSWDESLIGEVAQAIAREAAANEVGLILGPGVNIKRNPLCGRNFEYFSEDPLLTGRLAAAFIRGAEATGVGTSLKHFACNNQEYKRFSSDSIMDDRTLREIYLAGFEEAVREGVPATVMCAYNKINGTYCSDNRFLLTDILRTEWGFDGAVLTDWGAMSDRIKGFTAGCDLSMPGGSDYMEWECEQAVAGGLLDEQDINRSAWRVIKMVKQAYAAVEAAVPVDLDRHHELAMRAAQESAVLLKNADNLLPVKLQEVVFIGHMAQELRYQGSGSSHINPWMLQSVTQRCPDVPFAAGCRADGSTSDELLEQAAAAAKQAEIPIVFAGLTDLCESEGYDRSHMRMPDGHTRLIETVAAANPSTVVVLLCGSAVETPWEPMVKSILYMGLPGQAGAEAIINLLTGQAVPCGKLAETWPTRYDDCVCSSFYANGKNDAHYRESIYVGYRYYATAEIPVRFPFGHGLSYTTFAYTNLQLSDRIVRFELTNAGSVAAKEIAQVYLSPPVTGHNADRMHRPFIELRGFAAVTLEAGESKPIQIELDERSVSIWHNDAWTVVPGTYTVRVGSGSNELSLAGTLEVKADGPFCSGMGVVNKDDNPYGPGGVHEHAVPIKSWYDRPMGAPSHEDWERLLGRTVREAELKKGAFTMEHSVLDMKPYSLVMKILYKAIEHTVAKGFGGKKDYNDPHFLMMMTSAADASMSGIKISGGRLFRNYVVEGLLEMANGHYLKGIRCMLRRRRR